MMASARASPLQSGSPRGPVQWPGRRSGPERAIPWPQCTWPRWRWSGEPSGKGRKLKHSLSSIASFVLLSVAAGVTTLDGLRRQPCQGSQDGHLKVAARSLLLECIPGARGTRPPAVKAPKERFHWTGDATPRTDPCTDPRYGHRIPQVAPPPPYPSHPRAARLSALNTRNYPDPVPCHTGIIATSPACSRSQGQASSCCSPMQRCPPCFLGWVCMDVAGHSEAAIDAVMESATPELESENISLGTSHAQWDVLEKGLRGAQDFLRSNMCMCVCCEVKIRTI